MSEKKVKFCPEGYHTVTPYLTVGNLKALLEFLKRAFDAETQLMTGPDGEPRHAEIKLGTSRLMAGQGAADHKPMPQQLYLYLPDADATYQRALDAGATSLAPPTTQFYGDRHAGVIDTNGNHWWIATHVEDVAPEEMERRAAAAWGKK
jgi:PhnB protein